MMNISYFIIIKRCLPNILSVQPRWNDVIDIIQKIITMNQAKQLNFFWKKSTSIMTMNWFHDFCERAFKFEHHKFTHKCRSGRSKDSINIGIQHALVLIYRCNNYFINFNHTYIEERSETLQLIKGDVLDVFIIKL